MKARCEVCGKTVKVQEYDGSLGKPGKTLRLARHNTPMGGRCIGSLEIVKPEGAR